VHKHKNAAPPHADEMLLLRAAISILRVHVLLKRTACMEKGNRDGKYYKKRKSHTDDDDV
jgi:hypothetical protein